MDLTQNISALLEKLKDILNTETVIGEPITMGNVTIVPIISISFGAGTGTGSGKDEKGNDGSGGGAGVGGKITPTAVMIIKNDEVSVLPLTGKGSLDHVVAMLPELITKLKPEKKEDK